MPFGITYRAQVVYWRGEDIECSVPTYVESDDKPTFELAKAWGQDMANGKSPQPGRNFEDQFEIREYLMTDEGLEEERTWYYFQGRLGEVVAS